VDNLLSYINKIKVYEMIEVEILPENSIIYNILMEDNVSIVITKYFNEPDSDPFVTVIANKEIIFHSDVPIEILVEKINNTWSVNK